MRCHPWILAATIVTAACNCGGSADERAVGKEASKLVDLSPAAHGGFELLDAGGEPRATLRLKPSAGQRELLASTLTMRVALLGRGLPPVDQRLPPVEQRTQLEVTELGPETIAARFRFEGVAIASNQSTPEIAARLRASSQAVAGWTETKQLSTRGGFVDGALAVPEDADEQLRKSLMHTGESLAILFARLPEEPVGVGARWKYSHRLDSQGLELERTVHVRLAAREGDRVTLELELIQRCLSERFTRAGLPGEVEVRSFDSRGSGEVVLELDKLVPVEGHVELATKLDFTVPASEVGGEDHEVSTRVELELQL